MKIFESSRARGDFCGTFTAAKLLRLSVGTVQGLVEKNKLSAWKTNGGHRRISVQSVLDYQRQQGAKETAVNSRPFRLKVLVLEEDASAHDFLKNAFAQWNLPLDLTLTDASIASLITLSASKPDVLIMDLQMKGVDGLELLRTLRATPSFSAMAILVLADLHEYELAERDGFPERIVQLPRPLNINWLHGYFVALTQKPQAHLSPAGQRPVGQ